MELAQQLVEARGEELAVAREIFGGRAVERAVARGTAAVVVDEVDPASGEDDESGRVEILELPLIGADSLHVHGRGGGVLREVEMLDLGVDLFQIELQRVVGDLAEEEREESPALRAEASDDAIADAEEPALFRGDDAGEGRAGHLEVDGAPAHGLEAVGRPSPPSEQAKAAVDEDALGDLAPEAGAGHAKAGYEGRMSKDTRAKSSSLQPSMPGKIRIYNEQNLTTFNYLFPRSTNLLLRNSSPCKFWNAHHKATIYDPRVSLPSAAPRMEV